MGEFRMPSLGADMEAGTIVEWKVKAGDVVHRGDVVAVVDTEKADIDAEIFEDGVIGELLVPEGEKVPVGTPLATLVPAGAAMPAPPPTSPEPTAPPAPPAPRPVPLAPPPAAAPSISPRRHRGEPTHHEPAVLSPLVRRLAERNGVDVSALRGTGPGAVVRRADVKAAIDARHAARAGAPLAAPSVATPPRRLDRAQAMQQRIAALMERSNREIPHYWVALDIDVSPALEWLERHNAALPPDERILPAAMLLAATARAAAAVPNFNGHWVDGAYHAADGVELGVVVVLRTGGLLAPVLHDAARLDAATTMSRMADLVRRARAGHLRSSDMTQASITVSNLGDRGADEVLAVIHPPQVALVGFGRITERPWAVDGMLTVRPVVRASVAGDHRVSDGHQASRLLASIADHLRDPASLEEAS